MKNPVPSHLPVLLVAILIFAITIAVVGESTHAPKPAASLLPREPEIDTEAKTLLDAVEKAYSELKSADFSGEVSVNIDIPSEAHQTNQTFTSTFGAPNLFKHQIQDGLLMGSNGEEVYIYNDEANSYLSIDLPPSKVEMRSLPIVVPQVLQSQNPSLLFAVSKNGIREVTESFDEVRKGPDLEIDGQTYPVLMFCSNEQESELQMAIDPKTHLIRRFTIDFKPALSGSGVTNVQNAEVVVDYTRINANPGHTEELFAWTPPKDAFNVREPAGAARPEKPTKNLQGTQAPNFKLTTLEGDTVSLSQMRGKVVVLDFWATWSPPSAKSLPKMADMATEAGKDEVHVFAVNLEEDKDKVQTYVDLKKIELPVLMDDDGKVAKSYEVKTVPQTVVIGKDGLIKKVFAGELEDREQQVAAAVAAAKRQQLDR